MTDTPHIREASVLGIERHDEPEPQTCPTCGAAVRVHVGDEGTGSYEPAGYEQRIRNCKTGAANPYHSEALIAASAIGAEADARIRALEAELDAAVSLLRRWDDADYYDQDTRAIAGDTAAFLARLPQPPAAAQSEQTREEQA